MIISASRRTDIPAFFSDWFYQRIKEGFAYVRNPMNPHQVSKIRLSPDVVDCIVFWSKNPRPMLDRLDRLEGYPYYFQFTLNAYDKDMEQNLPPLRERLETFQHLSQTLGKQRVIWRYDPILLNDKYTVEWHLEKYAYLADSLYGYTERSTISFLDLYPSISSGLLKQGLRTLTTGEKVKLAEGLSAIARAHALVMDTCAEDIDLSPYQIEHGRCIDDRLIARLLGCPIDAGKDQNQRPACGCASSIDLGSYNTCPNGCIYCYANHNGDLRRRSLQAYDKNSPLLCSELTESDRITERRMISQRDGQMSLFTME